jgi:hypothetical protein
MIKKTIPVTYNPSADVDYLILTDGFQQLK